MRDCVLKSLLSKNNSHSASLPPPATALCLSSRPQVNVWRSHPYWTVSITLIPQSIIVWLWDSVFHWNHFHQVADDVHIGKYSLWTTCSLELSILLAFMTLFHPGSLWEPSFFLFGNIFFCSSKNLGCPMIPLLVYDSSLPNSSSWIMQIALGFSFLICKLGLTFSYRNVIRTT